MVNESFAEFSDTLQREIEDETGIKFGILQLDLFSGLTYRVQIDEEKLVRRSVEMLKDREPIPKARIVTQTADIYIDNPGTTYVERGVRAAYIQDSYSIPPKKAGKPLRCSIFTKGAGEYFDLSQLPPFQQAFSFGGEAVHETGYQINAGKCIGCQGCHGVCPQGCISNTIPRMIDPAHRIHCGNCSHICPVKAVEKLG